MANWKRPGAIVAFASHSAEISKFQHMRNIFYIWVRWRRQRTHFWKMRTHIWKILPKMEGFLKMEDLTTVSPTDLRSYRNLSFPKLNFWGHWAVFGFHTNAIVSYMKLTKQAKQSMMPRASARDHAPRPTPDRRVTRGARRSRDLPAGTANGLHHHSCMTSYPTEVLIGRN